MVVGSIPTSRAKIYVMNVLVFKYTPDFGQNIELVANNELDLKDYLEKEYDFNDIEFHDLHEYYGYCSFKTIYGRESVSCYYSKKI